MAQTLRLEVWGGASAAYLKNFRRRRFRELADAGEYMAAILDRLDILAVRGAHPMTVVDENDQDVTRDCWAAYESRERAAR